MLLLKLLFALYFAAVINCQCRKNPSKIIKAMNGESGQLRLVFAHRGIQTRTAVENTIRAVDEACKIDIDGIEIDVQIAKDGSLWPSHDVRVGRITNYRVKPGEPLFDILKDDPFGPKNPAFKDMTREQLNSLFVRNTMGEVQEGVVYHSVEFVLNHVKANYPHIAIVLDIKTANAVTPAAELVNRLGMQDQVVIKFLATWVPPEAVDGATKGVGFVLVLYCFMLDEFAAKGVGPNPQARVTSYIARYFNYENYVSLEGPTKNWYISRNKEIVIPTGPGGFVDSWMINTARRGIGKFHLRNDYNLGTVNYLGHCCVSADSYLSTSPLFGKEGTDQRFDANAVLKAADWVTTDAATDILADAVRMGFRAHRDLVLC